MEEKIRFSQLTWQLKLGIVVSWVMLILYTLLFGVIFVLTYVGY